MGSYLHMGDGQTAVGYSSPVVARGLDVEYARLLSVYRASRWVMVAVDRNEKGKEFQRDSVA